MGSAPNMGLELTTLGSRVGCSTNWAIQGPALFHYKTEVEYMKTAPSMSGKQEKTAQVGGSDSYGTYCYCYSASHSVIPVASWPPFPLTCYQWRKKLGPTSLRGLHGMLAPAKSWITVTLQSHSEVALKMLLKSFQEAEHLVVYFVGTKMARGLDSHCLMGNESWVIQLVRDLERARLKNWWQDVLTAGMWIGLWDEAQNMQVIVPT